MFTYKIKYYDPMADKFVYFQGIIAAESLSEAVTFLEEYYGKEELGEICQLKQINDNKIIELDEKDSLEDLSYDELIQKLENQWY